MDPVIEELCAKEGWDVRGDTINVPLPGGRHQEVRLTLHEAEGVVFARLLSVLGDAHRLDDRHARAALRLNWTMPYGAVALAAVDDGPEMVCLTATAQFCADKPELMRMAIGRVAKVADDYEKAVFHTDDH